MEFDKSKILTVVTVRQAKVGQTGWFGDTPVEIEAEFKMKKPCPLTEIRENVLYPFETDGALTALFYPAPEPTYAERQAEWVKENNVKKGTRLRVTKEFKDNEDGSDCGFGTDELRDKAKIVGQVGKVDGFADGNSIYLKFETGMSFFVPYTVLEVVKEPTYRPYNNDELNDLVGKVLIQKNTGNAMMAIKVVDGEVGKLISLGGSQKRNAQQLLDGWTHKNGEPCGVREEI